MCFLHRADTEARAEQRPLHQHHQRPVATRGEGWGGGIGRPGEPPGGELFVGSGGGGGGGSRARVTHGRRPRQYIDENARTATATTPAVAVKQVAMVEAEAPSPWAPVGVVATQSMMSTLAAEAQVTPRSRMNPPWMASVLTDLNIPSPVRQKRRG